MTFIDDRIINNAGKRTDPLIKIHIVAVSRSFDSNKMVIKTDNCMSMFRRCG